MPQSRARTAICSAPLEWPSRPGLPTRNLSAPPEPAAGRLDRRADLGEIARGRGRGLADAGRRAVLAEHLAQRRAPFAGGDAGLGGGDRGRHDVVARPRAAACSVGEGAPRRRPRRGPRARPSGARSARPRRAGSTTMMAPSPAVSGEGSVSVKRLTPTTVCLAGLDAGRAARRCSRPARPSCSRWRRPRRPSRRSARARPGRRPSARRPCASTTGVPSKMSSYSSRSVS